MKIPTARQGSSPERSDSIRVEITPAIQEAAVKLLAAIVAEVRGRLPLGSTFDDLTRVAINVALAYFEEQAAEERVIRFPFPKIEPPDAG
jgi:hypothetical protein